MTDAETLKDLFRLMTETRQAIGRIEDAQERQLQFNRQIAERMQFVEHSLAALVEHSATTNRRLDDLAEGQRRIEKRMDRANV